MRLELTQHLLLTLQPPTPQPQVLPLIPAQRMNSLSELRVTALQASNETDALPRKGFLVWLKGFFFLTNRNLTYSLKAPVKQDEMQLVK